MGMQQSACKYKYTPTPPHTIPFSYIFLMMCILLLRLFFLSSCLTSALTHLRPSLCPALLQLWLSLYHGADKTIVPSVCISALRPRTTALLSVGHKENNSFSCPPPAVRSHHSQLVRQPAGQTENRRDKKWTATETDR